MNVDDLTIGQLKELRGFACNDRAPAQTKERGMCIVAADRGHVWVGNVTEHGEDTHIKGARVIRYWGTTKGLNELVNGPADKTKLDAAADIIVKTKSVIYFVPVETTKWTV